MSEPQGTLSLKLAELDQAEVVAEIVRAAFKGSDEILGLDPAEHPRYAAFETAENVRRRMATGETTVLAYVAGRTVGTVSYHVATDGTASGKIKRLAILPEFRGKGHGQRLMEYAEQRLTELGAHMSILAIVAQFEGLQRYYERLGYNPTHTKSYPQLPFEVLHMEKVPSDQR